MSDTIITVEKLGKKYSLRHQRIERYTALRDVISAKAKSLFRYRGDKAASAVEEFWALRDVSFEVQRGEVVGIVGRNGAGKSTLLKILSRITEPTEGKVRIKGRVASLLEVGTGFHPELTGRENIFLNGAILGMSRAEIKAKFEEIVAFAEVEKFLDTPVKRYSSGMYVRLAFAVAAHLDPEILIVDEVLAVGDAEFQKKCLGKLQQVSLGEGRTVLFVSHNMPAVRSLCNSAIWLERGRIENIGPPLEIVDTYLSASLSSEANTFDLSSIPRPEYCGSQVRLTSVELNNGEMLVHSEPMTFTLRYEVRANVADIAFGVGFTNRDGVRIMSIDSDIPGPRLQLAPSESASVSCRISNLLLEPGTYLLDIGCRSGDNFAVDYVPACAQITVLPGPTTPSVIAMRSTGRGGVRLPAHWSLSCASSSRLAGSGALT